ncbi:MAG: efflux RND transporter periplasmic adaptor subunit [Spirochaetota bacterium]
MRSISGLLFIVLVVLVAAGCGIFPEEEDPVTVELPEPPRISTEATYPVERVDLYDEVRATAIVSPVRRTELYFERPGRLTFLAASPRQLVGADELLARLDVSSLEHELALAEIDLEIARTREEFMQMAWTSQMDKRVFDLQMRKVELRVERLQRLIDGATIRAPYDGIVERVNYEVSDEIDDYDTVIEVADYTDLELRVRLVRDQYEEVETGQRALVEVSPDEWREATVLEKVFVNASDDASIDRDDYFARVVLEDRRGVDLRVNSRLGTRIIIEASENALAIPLGALRSFNNETYVRVLDGETRREVYVETGIRTPTVVEIVDGLEEGMLVIGR